MIGWVRKGDYGSRVEWRLQLKKLGLTPPPGFEKVDIR